MLVFSGMFSLTCHLSYGSNRAWCTRPHLSYIHLFHAFSDVLQTKREECLAGVSSDIWRVLKKPLPSLLHGQTIKASNLTSCWKQNIVDKLSDFSQWNIHKTLVMIYNVTGTIIYIESWHKHNHWIRPLTMQTFIIVSRLRWCDRACEGSFISLMKRNNILAADAQTKQNMQMDFYLFLFWYPLSFSLWDSPWLQLRDDRWWLKRLLIYFWGFVLLKYGLVGLITSICHTHR